jgi:predicted dehydrogenase
VASVPTDRLRAAVIGVGHLGRHHARILGTLEGVELVAVVDTNTERAAAASATTGAPAFADFREVLDSNIDAVSIAVPTELHRDIALPFLQRGIAALVEKPIARSLSEADELVSAARASGAVLAVGQTERYNPAVAAVLPLVTSPRFIEVHRLGAFPDRSLDIDVVFDLMIHDLDIILALVKSDVQSIEAVGVPVLTSKYDIANAAASIRLRLHRQRDGQPDQQRTRPQDSLFPAGCVHLDRLCCAGSRRLAPRPSRWWAAIDRRRIAAGRAR